MPSRAHAKRRLSPSSVARAVWVSSSLWSAVGFRGGWSRTRSSCFPLRSVLTASRTCAEGKSDRPTTSDSVHPVRQAILLRDVVALLLDGDDDRRLSRRPACDDLVARANPEHARLLELLEVRGDGGLDRLGGGRVDRGYRVRRMRHRSHEHTPLLCWKSIGAC